MAQPSEHYNFYRTYDPSTGRYLEADPIGLTDPFSGLYAYVAADPVNRSDRFGLIGDPPMDPPTSSAPPSRTAPLSSSPARKSSLSDPFSSYQDFRFRRALGHQRFPGEPNSRLRHCVVSCELALDFGIGWPRAAGVANEMQGLWLDITNLRSRLGGASSWAFQLGDFSSNERGFSCSQSLTGGQSCEDCCREPCGDGTGGK